MRLPDEVLLRSDGAGRRTNTYDGHTYIAVSAWTSRDPALAAAVAIRAQGGLARVICVPRPVRSMPAIDRFPPIYEGWFARPQRRHKKTHNRWMWVVFVHALPSTEIAAHAGKISEGRA